MVRTGPVEPLPERGGIPLQCPLGGPARPHTPHPAEQALQELPRQPIPATAMSLTPADREACSPPPGSIVPWSSMIREADPPAQAIPRFPKETTPWPHQAILSGTGHPGCPPTNPVIETGRKCPPGSICLPHVLGGRTRNTPSPAPPLMTDSVPASPHPARPVAAVLQRLEAPSPQPDYLLTPLLLRMTLLHPATIHYLPDWRFRRNTR